MSKITYSRIKQILFSCVFRPYGPFKIISEVGDPKYYQQRACELIQEDFNNVENLRKAISLLALTIAEIELNEKEVT